MDQQDYNKYQIHYNTPKTDPRESRFQPKAPKTTLWQRIQDKYRQLLNEKLTIMVVPHNDAKMIHFHISIVAMIFLGILFFTTITVSAISFSMQSQISDQADNLYKEAHQIRQRIYLYKEKTHDINRNMAKMQKTTSDITEYVSASKNNDIYSAKRLQHLLFMDQLQAKNDKELNLITKLQQGLYYTGLQLQATKEFIHTRQNVIYRTPSIWPTKGHITSLFGYRRDPFTYQLRFHAALDIANRTGTPIYATAPGVVRHVGYNSGYGKYIELVHAFGFRSKYAHNSRNLVREGQRVRQGQMIARMGRTGRATGSHIHYEIHNGGYTINPTPYLHRR